MTTVAFLANTAPVPVEGAPQAQGSSLWVNLAISAVTLVLVVLFFRRLSRGDGGPKRPVRKWSGYEE